MKKSLIALALALAAAGCGGSDGEGGDGAVSNGATPEEQARGAVKKAVATAGLTGLYEGGAGPQRSQLCIIDKGTDNATFGINVWGGNMHSCSGSGGVVRAGDRLTLTMAGDSTCRIDATIREGIVSLPASVPDGCSYYCGARARFAGASFTRTGGSAEDAMRAKDLAGDSLCEG